MPELNFQNEQFKDIIFELQNLVNENNVHQLIDAFFLLIHIDPNDKLNNLKKEDLHNLCLRIQKYYKSLNPKIDLTLDQCFYLTQNINTSELEKNIILSLAYQCLRNGEHLGNNTILDGKINTSSWISHSIFMSEVCGYLAKCLNLDVDKAKTIGLLHDFGRKYNHTFNHVLIGFERLFNLGWTKEAIGCLTHSFVNGGRCANNDKAVEGFYVDESGNPKWNQTAKKDDVTLFLENYHYDDYDTILTLADLMATDMGTVAPHIRIKDIATRRELDPTNRSYFLTELTNLLIEFLNKTNTNNFNLTKIKASKDISQEEIENYFYKVSKYFFNSYSNLIKKEKNISNTF